MIPSIENKKPIYIMSLEASDIYNHNYRNCEIKRDYVGMIPFSLESLKLIENGLKTKYIPDREKFISNDIINVKFKSKVRNANEMIDFYKEKLQHSKNKDTTEQLTNLINELEKHSNKNDPEYWNEVSVTDLRKKLYINGFKIKFKNNRTGNIKEIEYVVYKRSSAKSRTGQCLFIKKSLYKKMTEWSRMYLPFKKGQEVDLASLLAYESLVGSSLEDVIEIDPYKILMVDDIESRFKMECNVVKKNEHTGYLDSFTEEETVVNSLFDGESLLESKYFKENKSMILLRNHMFKSAAFNCNIQLFLKDQCPKDVDYEEWELEDMFGNRIKAKDVEMITTPSSLKALKFSNVLPSGTKKEMWDYWRELVNNEDCLFGICKHEKPSKIGADFNGNTLQQVSYQMVNCLPANKKDIKTLLNKEIEYIKKLKEDNDFLVNEIYKFRNATNSNEALCSLYNYNNQIINTKLFKNFKSQFIKKRVNYAKKGKIKINGDYCVMLGNPIEFLYHAIGKFDVSKGSISLHYNEIYTNLYDFDKKMIGFRNPNTSPSNVLIVKNKNNKEIARYFNLTKNIVCVNAINFAIQDILSGSDYDSDTVLLSSEEKLVKIGEKCFGKYNPCLNKIKGSPKQYRLTKEDHFEIDEQLSHSQKNIGKVVNLGQFAMSVYWDLINKNKKGKDVDELLKKVDVMTVLSGIAIDMAKKFYDIDIECEIKHVSQNEMLKKYKKKPLFWVSVSQSNTIKNRVMYYRCPMDYLIKTLSETLREINNNSLNEESLDFEELMTEQNVVNSNFKQVKKMEELLIEYDTEFKKIMANSQEKEEDYRKTEDLTKKYINKIKKWKIKEETASSILKRSYVDGGAFLLRAIKFLYESHPETLLKSIKKGDFCKKFSE